MYRTVLVLTFTVLAGMSSVAQVVNIENLRLKGKDKGWTGSEMLNFAFTQNTSQIWQIGNRLKLGYLDGQHSVLFTSTLNFVKADVNDFVNDGFEHLRYNYQLKDSGMVSFELFKQFQYNKVQAIRLRSIYGGGVRVHAINQDSAQLIVGVTPFAEFEDVTDGTYNRHVRLGGYFSLDVQFSKTFGFNTITYYQPDIIYWKDYRLSHETSIRAGITRQLGLRVIFNLNYDSFPPAGIPQSFYSISNAISFTF
jgi:hypothetical protein